MNRILVAGCMAIGLVAGATAGWCADNLMFVPVQPCRVIDTRVAGAGGPLAPGTSRSFVFRGPTRNYQSPSPFPNQGGSTTGCGIPDLTSDATFFGSHQNIAQSVAINIVAVGPAGVGDLRAWPANQPMPAASVLNYAALSGLNIANGVIVPMCDQASTTPCAGGDITFRADVSGTHLVVDVVGYFHAGSTVLTVSNTALGHQALQAGTTGRWNTATGAWALGANTTGYSNTASGYTALKYNTTGYSNTANGVFALFSNTTGSKNTASGVGALEGNTIGLRNSASGAHALFYNSTGNDNTASGASALGSNTTGYGNTANGSYALSNNTTGDGNTACGGGALYSNTTGQDNTAVGESALLHATGSYNIAIGKRAGINIVSGSGNIDIGGAGSGDESNTIRIGFGTAQTETHIAGIRGVTTMQSDAVAVLIDSTGQLGTTSSSLRVKQDIEDVGEASERILGLRPVKFRYKEQAARGDTTPQFGLIAEEVARVLPELVVYDKTGQPETVKYHLLPALLLDEMKRQQRTMEAQQKAMQEERTKTADRLAAQQLEIDAQRSAIAALRQQNQALASSLAKIEALQRRLGELDNAPQR